MISSVSRPGSAPVFLQRVAHECLEILMHELAGADIDRQRQVSKTRVFLPRRPACRSPVRTPSRQWRASGPVFSACGMNSTGETSPPGRNCTSAAAPLAPDGRLFFCFCFGLRPWSTCGWKERDGIRHSTKERLFSFAAEPVLAGKLGMHGVDAGERSMAVAPKRVGPRCHRSGSVSGHRVTMKGLASGRRWRKNSRRLPGRWPISA